MTEAEAIQKAVAALRLHEGLPSLPPVEAGEPRATHICLADVKDDCERDGVDLTPIIERDPGFASDSWQVTFPFTNRDDERPWRKGVSFSVNETTGQALLVLDQNEEDLDAGLQHPPATDG